MSLEIALMIVSFLIVIVGIVSGITCIWLVVKIFVLIVRKTVWALQAFRLQE